jgi:hypothetical protein
MKTFCGYGNFWKIYGMSPFRLWLLELCLLLIIYTRPLRVARKNIFVRLSALRFLIITPSGIMPDRRTRRPYHFINERRLVEIIRRKVLLMFDNDHNPQP